MLKSKSVELKLVIVGNDCVGKTSIASYIKSKVFSENYTSTVGAGFYDSTFCIDGINIDLYIWDTAGKEIYHPLLPMMIIIEFSSIFLTSLIHVCKLLNDRSSLEIKLI